MEHEFEMYFPGIGAFVPSHSPVADKLMQRILSSCQFFRDPELLVMDPNA